MREAEEEKGPMATREWELGRGCLSPNKADVVQAGGVQERGNGQNGGGGGAEKPSQG